MKLLFSSISGNLTSIIYATGSEVNKIKVIFHTLVLSIFNLVQDEIDKLQDKISSKSSTPAGKTLMIGYIEKLSIQNSRRADTDLQF